MDEKNKKVLEGEGANPQREEPNTPNTPQGDPASGEPKAVDYKAELEKINKSKEQAEYNIVDLKKKNKDLVNEIEELKANGGSKVDIDAIKQEIEENIKSENSKFKNELLSDTVDEFLGALSSNPDEKELIRHHYNNTIVKTGSKRSDIFNDLKNAALIANRPKYESDMKEMEAIIFSKGSANHVGDISSKKEDNQRLPELSPQEKVIAQRTAMRTGESLADVEKRLAQSKLNS